MSNMPKEFYIWMKPISRGTNKCHLIKEVDDGDTKLVVFKNWNRRWCGWDYYVQERCIVEQRIKDNAGADGKIPKGINS